MKLYLNGLGETLLTPIQSTGPEF